MPSARIAVLLLEMWPSCEELLRGVLQYSSGEDGWEVLLRPGTPDRLAEVAAWKPDGILASVRCPRCANEITTLGCPVVNVRGTLDALNVPRVGSDELAVGRLAAEHLLDQGYQQFACVTALEPPFLRDRAAGFLSALSEHPSQTFTCQQVNDRGLSVPEPVAQALEQWLRKLSRPVGIFAANDGLGRLVCRMARELEVPVPDLMGVVAVDDHRFLCQSTRPPLTMIVPAYQQIGFQAAALLAQLLAGAAPQKQRHAIPPDGIRVQRSSNALAITDPEVAVAVRFIRTQCHAPIKIQDVVQSVSISRRALEKKFMAVLGHSPNDELRRARIRLAKRLLLETHDSIADVAERSGFGSSTQLSTLFRQFVGLRPHEYRSVNNHSPSPLLNGD